MNDLKISYVPKGKQYMYPQHYVVDSGAKTIGAFKDRQNAELFVALFVACKAVVGCWERGDLAGAARMCADAVSTMGKEG